MRALGIFTTLLLCAAVGCGSDGPASDGPDGGPGAGPDGGGVDQSDTLFDQSRIIEVTIDLAPADWDALRHQTRSVLDILGGDCLAQPFGSPFTYFHGSATVNGHSFDDVGVRKKGFLGSLSETKPSIKLKLDEYVKGQDLFGLDKLTFNNSVQDPSYLHQCVAYDRFRAAHLAAPRCNFAHVTVNGQDMGLYVQVESIDKQFIERHFANPDGKLYEGTLSDFRPEFEKTFELKTNGVADDRADIDAVVAALEAPDADLESQVSQVVNLDQYDSFWAMEVLTEHWDGYASDTNNFMIYDDPGSGRFHFIPWGTDSTFTANPLITTQPPQSVFATGMLARRLYLDPTTRDNYVARLRQLLDSAWDEDAMLAQIDGFEALITPVADPDGTMGLAGQIDDLRSEIQGKRDKVTAELDSGPPAWTQPLRQPMCLATLGSVNVTFSTTWGTLGAQNPFATGSGTWDVTVQGTKQSPSQIGATSGIDPNDTTQRPQLQVVAYTSASQVGVLTFQLQPSAYAGGDHPVNWNGVSGQLYNLNTTTGAVTLVALVGQGTLTLDQTSQTDGQPVSGRVTANLVQSPF